MEKPFVSSSTYRFLFALIGIVYFIGLFVPLQDNDSAHHAAIALQMHLTGDYASLIDWNGNYLDKPHLHFWLAAFSYKILGVTGFAYKFPSFLLSILGIYSVYRLGRSLNNVETGKLAALLMATAFAFMLAVMDVRMDAMLTAFIAYASWQLVAFVQHRHIKNIAGAALGLAMAFSTKGHIGVFVPAVFILFYILYRKEYLLFINWKWLLLLVFFGIFISPVLYAYYLQYNLHPEIMVRGKDHINGVKFILFNQSIERFDGSMGHDASHDYLFFIHSFIWAFAPWSVLTYLAFAKRLKNIFNKNDEWGSTGVFMVILLIVSFSSFKLPHYLNVIFPVAAVITASYILKNSHKSRWVRNIYWLQIALCVILLLGIVLINGWAFPVNYGWVIAGVILFLALVFYFFKSALYSRAQKLVLVPVACMLLLFFLMNANFFPKLLSYQAGQRLAAETKGKVDPQDVYTQPGSYTYSSSYTFYTSSVFKNFNDSLLNKGRKIWLLADPEMYDKLKNNYVIGEIYKAPHYRITQLSLNFLNPTTRESELGAMMIVQVIAKK